jgi:hypothetical protein
MCQTSEMYATKLGWTDVGQGMIQSIVENPVGKTEDESNT